MSGHRLEVADVIRNYGAAYQERYRPSKEQRRVLSDLAECRTPALGGHLKKCDRCGHEVPVYNSCRNRHCPKCQGAARSSWLKARQQERLDVEYFHVVFTLPQELAPLALQNRRIVYELLHLQNLVRRQRHGRSIFYAFPLVRTTSELLALRGNVVTMTQLVDVATIPPLPAPVTRYGSLRKSGVHYANVDHKCAVFYSEPVTVPVLPAEALFGPNAALGELGAPADDMQFRSVIDELAGMSQSMAAAPGRRRLGRWFGGVLLRSR